MTRIYYPPSRLVSGLKNANWFPANMLSHYHLSPLVKAWITEDNSMTRRLKKTAKIEFKLELLQQSWQYPWLTEARRLNLDSSRLAVIREVSLSCDYQPYIVARAVFPPKTLTGKGRPLLSLGEKPLGEFLFKQPGLKRSQFEYAYNKAQKIWARRSVFYLAKKPLLLTEVFLPGMFEA